MVWIWNPAAAITYGTNQINSNYQWRIPFICQCFACVCVIFFVWFIPESPRWLIAQGREEEAAAFLTKYHGNGDPNARLVRLEIEEMKEGIRIDGIDKRWWDCTCCVFFLVVLCRDSDVLTTCFIFYRSPLYDNTQRTLEIYSRYVVDQWRCIS